MKYFIRLSDAETVKMNDITPQVLENADDCEGNLDVTAECLLEDWREANPDFDVQLIRQV